MGVRVSDYIAWVFFLWGSEILNIFRYLSWNLNENKMLKYNRWK